MIVDGAVVCMVHVPVVEGSCILTKLVALEAAAVTVGGQQHIVHHLNHCGDAIHRSMALPMPSSIEADIDGHRFRHREVWIQHQVHVTHNDSTLP